MGAKSAPAGSSWRDSYFAARDMADEHRP